jgi:hypothetical protein
VEEQGEARREEPPEVAKAREVAERCLSRLFELTPNDQDAIWEDDAIEVMAHEIVKAMRSQGWNGGK